MFHFCSDAHEQCLDTAKYTTLGVATKKFLGKVYYFYYSDF